MKSQPDQDDSHLGEPHSRTDGMDAEEIEEVTAADAGGNVDSKDAQEFESSDIDAVPPKRSRRFLRWATILVMFAVLAAPGYEGWLLWRHHQKETAAAQALDAAVNYTVILTNVDPNAIDKNFTEVLGGSTGEFKDLYAKSSDQLRQLLLDNKAAAHGRVIDAAVESSDNVKAVVLLFVDQSVSNAATSEPQIDRSRIRMTMENVEGRWLASKVELP